MSKEEVVEAAKQAEKSYLDEKVLDMELGELKVTLREAKVLRHAVWEKECRLKTDPPNSIQAKELEAIRNLDKRLGELFPDDYLSEEIY